MAGTLEGITVVDAGSGPAAALASMFLSDHGAHVVRIVRDGAPLHRDGGFIVWDRGKAAVALELDQAAQQIASGAPPAPGTPAALLDELTARADVLIEDFAPSSPLQALVLPARLHRLNSRLVACSITAYGKRGPWKNEPPIDDLVLARTGLLSGMPGFRPAPVHVVHPLPTVGAALYAAIGIASALLARERTGRGRMVETSLMAGALLYQAKVTGERIAPHVFQTHPSGSAAFYSVYRCADGRWVQLGCVHAAFIATAAKLMGLTELMTAPRFAAVPMAPEADAELRKEVARVIATRAYSAWAEAFEAADVPFAEARLTHEGMSDPQVLHNGMVQTLADPKSGPVTQMGVPIVLTETPGRIAGPRAATVAATLDEVLAPRAPAPAPTAPQGPDAPPLAGYRILEITNLIAGPTGGRILADLGADVIKLEPPAGDMSRPIGRTYFYSVNFNKRSVCIDTGTAAGKAVVQRIAASADAMMANLRPKATERMGIVPANNPRLIETHLTGYGFTGPYSHRPGIDPLAQALMGLQRAQGGPENPPVFPAQLAPTDYTTGAMGALGTILALYARERTGIVQRVESNLLSGGIVLSSEWFTAYAGRPERPLADKGQYGLGPFHRLYRLADGWIYIVAETPDMQSAVRRLCGVPESLGPAPEPGRHPADGALAQALAEAFAGRTCGATLAELARLGVPAAPAPRPDNEIFLEDPHAIAADQVAVRQHPKVGTIKVAWQAVQFGDTKPSLGRATPLLGEHSREVLAETGYSQAEIDALVAAGTVRIERA